MFRIKFPIILMTIVIFVSSCGQLKSSPQPLPSPSNKWTVILNQSGGIAGVLLTVEISSDGQLTAEDQRSHRTVKQTLPSQTLTQLNQLVSSSSVSSTSTPQSGCADCFVYDLEVQTEESSFQAHLDDVTMKNSRAADLIAFMIKLRDDALRS